MRVYSWFATLLSLLMLMAAGASTAQSDEHSTKGMSFEEAIAGRAQLSSEDSGSGKLAVRGQSGPPGYGLAAGSGFQPAYRTNHPTGIRPPQTPSGYQPYPAISPYFPANVTHDSTYNDRGLWFRRLLHRKRDYFFTLEYLHTGYRDPGNSNIGAPTLPVNLINNQLSGLVIGNNGLGGPGGFGPGTDGFGDQQRIIVGPGVLPYPAITESAGDDRLFQIDDFAFPVRTLDVINHPVEADGIRSRWGYMNEDGTGLMLTGWYGGLGQDQFRLGQDNWNGIPITQDFILANTPDSGFAPIFPRNGILPLEFAEGFPADIDTEMGVGQNAFGLTGWAQKFDVLFHVDVETRAFGTTLNLYHEPIFQRKWVSVRPTFGARYIYVDDRFGFRGIDSGLGYEVDSPSGASGGGGGTGPTFRPSGDSVHVPTDVNGLPIPLFFEATLQSEVDTHLAGPEAGIRYDFGQSKNFSIWGQSTFALLANHERVKSPARTLVIHWTFS